MFHVHDRHVESPKNEVGGWIGGAPVSSEAYRQYSLQIEGLSQQLFKAQREAEIYKPAFFMLLALVVLAIILR